MSYPIVIEFPAEAGDNLSAYSPDFDGVVATGDTVEECAVLMTEALALHIKGMIEDGDVLPPVYDRVVRMVEPVLD